MVKIIFYLFILLCVINKLRFHYDMKETIIRTVMTPFTGTIWSKNYSEDNFLKIKIGMTMTEVNSLMGDPLDRDCLPAECFLRYSNQDTPTADYDRRWVSFGPDNKVNDIQHEFFID